jgi:hypothetical protein
MTRVLSGGLKVQSANEQALQVFRYSYGWLRYSFGTTRRFLSTPVILARLCRHGVCN